MKEIVSIELEMAAEKLDSAKLLLRNEKLSDAVNRAYFSMFHAARALLRIYDKEPKTHEGLLAEFGLTLIKTGLLDKKFGRMFREAQDAREASDYKIFVIFEREEVEDILKNAEKFLKVAKKLSVELLKGKKFKK